MPEDLYDYYYYGIPPEVEIIPPEYNKYLMIKKKIVNLFFFI